MNTYTFKYGERELSFQLGDDVNPITLTGNEAPEIENIREAVYASLEHPVDSVPLKAFLEPGDGVALVISDMSRFWMRQDLVIPHIINYMNTECGIPDENIAIVVANGTHDGVSEPELEKLVGPSIFRRIDIVNHDCQAMDLVYIGTTSHGTRVSVNPFVAGRKVVTLGACTHHVMAGYGGGRKSILPGVASMEAIKQNHALSLDPNEARSNPLIGNGILEGNPLNDDMCQAASFLRYMFVINLVMNKDMKLSAIISGDRFASWEQGCKLVDSIYSVPVEKEADIIITSCGGYPKDMSLYQGTKAIDNVEPALKLGGTLILAAECRDGGGPDEYFDWIRPLRAGTLDRDLRENFTIPGYIFYLNCEQAQRYRIMMLSELNKDDASAMGIEVYRDMDELLSHVDFKDKVTYIIPNGSTVIPRVKE